jgi:hypothetical protein
MWLLIEKKSAKLFTTLEKPRDCDEARALVLSQCLPPAEGCQSTHDTEPIDAPSLQFMANIADELGYGYRSNVLIRPQRQTRMVAMHAARAHTQTHCDYTAP